MSSFYEMISVIFDTIMTVTRILLSFVYSLYRLAVPKQLSSLTNDIVLVTGAAHGIGKELVKLYGDLGAQVVCVDINEKGNQATAGELTKQKVKAFAYTCDVTDRDSVFALADRVRRDVGFVTILVNNAGVMPYKQFLDHTPEEIQRTFNVNVLAHFWMVQAFLPAMVSNDYGSVVAVSSIAGLLGNANITPYCSTKFAIRGLMDGLRSEARELKYNVKFTTAYPFAVDTGLCETVRIGSPNLLGMQTPKDVASAIVLAQRRGMAEVSCPFYLHKGAALSKLLPERTRDLVTDYLKTGVDPQQ